MIRFFSNLITIIACLGVLGSTVVIGLFYYYGRGLPDYQHLEQYEPPVVTRLYANDGRLFAEYAAEKRVFVPIEAIPKRIIQTFLAAEDKNFYEHSGLDFSGILRAAFTNIRRVKENRRPVGASTITQQVAKNFLLNDISTEVSFARKIKEAILAFRLEHAYTKDHILELYLNEIYLGAGSYGVAAAALNYFNKSLGELTIAEAAFLAGLPKAPSHYNPLTAPERAKSRRDWVIRRMFEEGIINHKDAETAIQQPLVTRTRDPAQVVQASYFAEEVRRSLLLQFGEHALYEGGLSVHTSIDAKLQDIAQRSLRKGLIIYDRRHGWRGPVTRINLTELKNEEDMTKNPSQTLWLEPLKRVPEPQGMKPWSLAIILALDHDFAHIGLSNGSKAQIPLSELKWARRFITSDRQGPEVRHPKDVLALGDVVMVEPVGDKSQNYKLCQIPAVSGSVVVLDPHTGRILAMSGGYSFEISQYNRATQAYRQSGSAFKPFVYLAALAKGLTPSTLILDGPIALNMGYGLGVWKPRNYDNKFLGPITLRSAFEKSRNTVPVRMTQEMTGIKPVIDIAQRLEIVKNLPQQMAMVLGAAETTLLKLTTAYGMIANGGRKISPTLIDRVADRHGKTIWKREEPVCKRCHSEPWMNQPMPELSDKRVQVIDPQTAYQMISILEGVIERGTGRSVKKRISAYPLAGKTGTTNNCFDGWFIGFSPDLVAGFYVGFDSPQTLGDKETGARVAAPMFADFMDEALKGKPAVPFRIPSGVKLVRVNYHTGLPTASNDPQAILEVFKTGYEPSNPKNIPEQSDLNFNPRGMPFQNLDPTNNFNRKTEDNSSFSSPQQTLPLPQPTQSEPLKSMVGTGEIY